MLKIVSHAFLNLENQVLAQHRNGLWNRDGVVASQCSNFRTHQRIFLKFCIDISIACRTAAFEDEPIWFTLRPNRRPQIFKSSI